MELPIESVPKVFRKFVPLELKNKKAISTQEEAEAALLACTNEEVFFSTFPSYIPEGMDCKRDSAIRFKSLQEVYITKDPKEVEKDVAVCEEFKKENHEMIAENGQRPSIDYRCRDLYLLFLEKKLITPLEIPQNFPSIPESFDAFANTVTFQADNEEAEEQILAALLATVPISDIVRAIEWYDHFFDFNYPSSFLYRSSIANDIRLTALKMSIDGKNIDKVKAMLGILGEIIPHLSYAGSHLSRSKLEELNKQLKENGFDQPNYTLGSSISRQLSEKLKFLNCSDK